MKSFIFLCLLLVGMIATVNASPPGVDTHNQFTMVQVLDESGIVIAAIDFACMPDTDYSYTARSGSIVYDQQLETIYLDPAEKTPVNLARSRLTCLQTSALTNETTLSGFKLLITPRSRAWVTNKITRSSWSFNGFHDGDFYKA